MATARGPYRQAQGHMQVRRLDSERRAAVAEAARMQKEQAAAADTRRTLDASFERLDRARERTRAALSSSRTSRTGAVATADGGSGRGLGSAASIAGRRLGPWSLGRASAPHDAGVQEGAAERPQSSAGALTSPAGRSHGAALRLHDRGPSEKGPFASAVPSRGGAGSQITFADRMKPAIEARLAGLDPLAKPDRY